MDPIRHPDRLAALQATGLTHSVPQEELDRLTELARQALGADAAVLNLLDDSRQVCLSADDPEGLLRAGDEAPIGRTLCERVVRSAEPVVLPDVRQAPWTLDLPSVVEGRAAAYLGVPLRTPEGEVIGALCALGRTPRPWSERDIALLEGIADSITTEIRLHLEIRVRADAEAALRQSEARFRHLVEGVQDYAIFALDREGTIRSWNHGAERILGYPAEEAIGRTVDTFHTEEERVRDHAAEILRQARLHGRYEEEGWRIRKDGGRVWVRSTLTLLTDDAGEPLGYTKIIRDLTERREAERERAALLEEVARERLRLAEVFERAPAFLSVLRGPDHVVEMANPAYYRLIGHRDIVGRPVREALPEVVEQGFVAILDRVRASGQAFVGSEVPITLQTEPKGPPQQRYVSFVYQPLHPSGADPDGILVHGVDVTETVQARRWIEGAAAEARLNLARLEAVLQALPVGVFVADAEGVVHTTNRAAQEIWGGTTPLVGMGAYGAYRAWRAGTGEPLAPDEWPIARAIRTGEPYLEEELEIEAFDGTRKTILASGVVFRDAEGRIAGGVAVNHDVTGNKEAEERLRRRDALLEAASHAATRFLRAPDWRREIGEVLRRIGDAADADRIHLFQVVEEHRGRSILTQVHEWTAREIASERGSARLRRWTYAELGIPEFDDDMRAGRERQLVVGDLPELERRPWEERGIRSILSVPIHLQGGWWGVLGVDTCRVGREWSESEREVFRVLAEVVGSAVGREMTEARLASIIDSAMDAIISVDEEQRIRVFNPAAERMLGASAQEAIGEPLDRFIPGRHRTRHRHQVREFGGSGVTARSMGSSGPLVALRADGREIPIEASISQTVGGQRKLYTVILRDISEQLRTEAQLRQTQKMEAVGRLAGGVAHDFNNMLTAIRGHAELLLEEVGADDPMRESVEEIRLAAERSAALTRQLLAFSRKQILQPRVLNLNEVVVGMAGMLRRLIGEHIEFTTVLKHETHTVRADPGQLEQVLLNLVVNARDAMTGGGKLTIETRNVELSAESGQMHDVEFTPGRYVLLSVSDTGEGMDAETRKHLFEPFFTTKGPGKGTGLGLPTVYGIVRQSGGYVWVYSEPGRGSTFKIYLPAVEAAEAAGPTQTSPPPVPRATGTVLLVEDEPAVRALAARVLRRGGYTVLEAAGGEEALRIAESYEHPIDLVLTDVVMPQMGGRAMVDRLPERFRDVQVLFMSGYTDEAIVQHGVLNPGVAFLQKPFLPDDLLRTVHRLLRRGD
jgi:PAS domain S-box-containing protein